MLFKQGAMLGLDARIKKLCHPGLGSGSPMNTAKLGAMFGLDARIALAIFGALSVISGAALYSAIQEAKVVQVLSQIKEVEKAFEQFYLDTGSKTKQEAAGMDTINIEELIDNTENLTGWKGPYVSMEASASRNGLATEYNDIILRVRNKDTQWGEDSLNPDECLTNDCYIWIGWLDVPTAIADGIDEKVDGELDKVDGKVRYHSWTATGKALFVNTGIKFENYQP